MYHSINCHTRVWIYRLFVYEFRGNEFTYADLKSAGTGLSVVTKYKFVIDYKFCM